ncbi:putative two-component system sensor kinase [Actinoplanes missouriensis 431]|uniref:histidine kinase n=1 Tax=Actinoplanes missouriensis (strain ATCC 14538 / DSM 43046 / CBS 188.64 / JCM 3121 / NBRC 102363 / NCIMB 12654 / NRRL B-3342 / UNCC 431) TaxID=512565 RepID=I0HAQ6_ACTM4|nr:HAMP domain-containing sensor histidine kinase [Actinoplanes missouriensis]BAL90093.1 putative two-component system sensor kinase [Actinoplanes missouriensis 431]
MKRWSQWTLRSRLVLVVGILSAIALLAANAVGVLLIRSYLQDRIDEQLVGISRPMSEISPWQGVAPRAGGRFRIGADQVTYLYRADGTLDPARSSATADDRPAVESLSRVAERVGQPYTVSTAGGADWRMIAVAVGDTGGYAVIGSSLIEVEQTTERLLIIDLGVMVLILGLLGAGAAFVVRLGLRPLTSMETVAADISGGNLSGRVPGPDPHTEPGRLALALNAMLTRIEAEVDARTHSEQRLRQFVADASHELRTPLTSIRGFAELYRRGGVLSAAELDETMARIEGEAGRMGVLVEDLLMLARLDRQRTLEIRRVDLLEIAADAIRDGHARAPDRSIVLADMFEPVMVLGDDHGLRQVATNLVANALNHTPPGTTVTVRVGHFTKNPDSAAVRSGPVTYSDGVPFALLEVSDDGPGVTPEHAPRVFERLYRADSSRSRASGGGSGLGLAIVAAIVHTHGGWVELVPSESGGACFRVLIPAISDSL